MAYTNIKQKIDLLREQIASHGKLTPEQLKKINYKFRLEWNYNSNSMEGNTLTIEETRSVMVGNIMVDKKPYKDIAEMKGHDEVISDILKIGKGELRLSEARIKQIHEAIMYEETEEKKAKIGKWKQINNYIYNYKGERFDFVDFKEVQDKMHDLLNRTNAAIDAIENNKKHALHPLDVAFNFHLEYVNIHPFYDGNGRTARILTNLILIALGYPPFWITEPQRAPYSNYLGDIQGYAGDPDLFHNFLAELVLRSQQLIIDVIEGRDIEADDDLDKEIALLKKELQAKAPLKNPALIQKVFVNLQNEIWPSLLNVLNKFDQFFFKNIVSRFIDDILITIPPLGEALLPLTQFSHPNKYWIIDKDITKKDIHEIRWESHKSELIKGDRQIIYETKLVLNFNEASYILKLVFNNDVIVERELYYDQYLDKDAILSIKRKLGKTLLDHIKSSLINEQ